MLGGQVLTGFINGLSIGQMLIWVLIIGGCVALTVIGLRAMNVTPPAWAVQAFWVVVIVLVLAFGIKLLMSAL